MPVNLVALVSFVLIATFTPGPSNIASASMGVLHGYRKTLNFLAGLAGGFVVVMLLSGWLSATLLGSFPALEPTLRYLGAAYILYLVFGILKASYRFDFSTRASGNDAEVVKPMGFAHGFTLQVLNPKMMIYAFTLFSTFLAPIRGDMALLALVVSVLAATAFVATSVWALFGTLIKRYLHSPRVAAAVNATLALFLVYTAVDLAGIL